MTLQKHKEVDLLQSIHDKSNVVGCTHNFYNYPARFSPNFVQKAIELFTVEGDLVLDPFMGGGTTLVESQRSGRISVGLDVSSLSLFITKVKTTKLRDTEITQIHRWWNEIQSQLNCHSKNIRPLRWIELGYQRNLSNGKTWPIRKTIEQYLHSLESSKLSKKCNNFLRCVVLKAGQWALDSRKEIPSTREFKSKIHEEIESMISGLKDQFESSGDVAKVYAYNKSATNVNKVYPIKKYGAPKLILTSPPYPGVHVLYHRWQINGRRETSAPFWISNTLDGQGITYYALGNRNQKELQDYFNNIQAIFKSLAKICNQETMIAQMLAFSEPDWQLPKYLKAMESAGFREHFIYDKRIWRDVPNRKWYANLKGSTNSSQEVVLFHKLV